MYNVHSDACVMYKCWYVAKDPVYFIKRGSNHIHKDKAPTHKIVGTTYTYLFAGELRASTPSRGVVLWHREGLLHCAQAHRHRHHSRIFFSSRWLPAAAEITNMTTMVCLALSVFLRSHLNHICCISIFIVFLLGHISQKTTHVCVCVYVCICDRALENRLECLFVHKI